MATLYEVKIKTVSAYCAYDEEYMQKMFEKFLKEYRDKDNGMGFENTKIEVKRL
tara:strand:+ start:664 stop:825 length:162 start_codon:yes stop_codon:yes gene_type:complete